MDASKLEKLELVRHFSSSPLSFVILMYESDLCSMWWLPLLHIMVSAHLSIRTVCSWYSNGAWLVPWSVSMLVGKVLSQEWMFIVCGMGIVSVYMPLSCWNVETRVAAWSPEWVRNGTFCWKKGWRHAMLCVAFYVDSFLNLIMEFPSLIVSLL